MKKGYFNVSILVFYKTLHFFKFKHHEIISPSSLVPVCDFFAKAGLELKRIEEEATKGNV